MRNQLWWRAWCASREQEQMLSSPITLSKPPNGWRKTVLSKHLILWIATKLFKFFLIWEKIFVLFFLKVGYTCYNAWVDADVPLLTVTYWHARTAQSSTVQSNAVRYETVLYKWDVNYRDVGTTHLLACRLLLLQGRDSEGGGKWRKGIGIGWRWKALSCKAKEWGKNWKVDKHAFMDLFVVLVQPLLTLY